MIGNDLSDDAKTWLKQASLHNGSWWNGWYKWLQERSGKLEKSIDYNKLEFIEMAPGRYVCK